MSEAKLTTEESRKLKFRVLKVRSQLKEIGIVNSKYWFTLSYPEYKPGKLLTENKVNNLFYGKVADKEFTKKLEDFFEVEKHRLFNDALKGKIHFDL